MSEVIQVNSDVVSDDNPFPVKVLSGGGGGAGDASAANQLTQIAAEEAIQAAVEGTLTVGLPSGASTEAKQPALGTAGTPSADVISVQGQAGMTPVASVGLTTNPTATFTRPADTTAYASGDLVANSTTAGSVAAMSLTVTRVAAGSCILRKIKLHKSGTSTTNASFRVHLFRAAPSTVTNGDNGVFSVSGVADYLGAMDITMSRAFTDGAVGFGVPLVGSELSVKLASGTTIAALIEARGAYTPASAEVFTVTLEDLQD